MRIYTSKIHKRRAHCTQSEGHTNSAISPDFSLYCLRSQRYAEAPFLSGDLALDHIQDFFIHQYIADNAVDHLAKVGLIARAYCIRR